MPQGSEGNRTTAGCGSKRVLERLWVEFVKLQRLRCEIRRDFDLDRSRDSAARDDAKIADQVLEPIADQLVKLACHAAAIEAESPEEVEYKAIMLAEYLPPHDRALHVVLARSLIDDIKRSSASYPIR